MENITKEAHVYAEGKVKAGSTFNPLNAELNPICYLLALLAHHFLHVSRIRVKSLTLRRAARGRSPAEILGSNPTGGMDICLL